jgi:hypothetical protein
VLHDANEHVHACKAIHRIHSGCDSARIRATSFMPIRTVLTTGANDYIRKTGRLSGAFVIVPDSAGMRAMGFFPTGSGQTRCHSKAWVTTAASRTQFFPGAA